MFPPLIDLPPDLYRVEINDHPLAISSSVSASVLEEAPTDIPWRYESMAIVDRAQGIGIIQPEATYDALNIHSWHDAGFQGQGISIAVFDVEWFGVDWPQSELAPVETHDCFAHRSCEPPIDTAHIRFGFERGVHGFACAEIIRDLAPQASLHLVRVNGHTSLQNAVDWAIRENIDIISMSLSFFNESFYDGTGPISALMDPLANNDIAMITSAGNYAQQHFRSAFNDSDGDNFHDFDNSLGLPVYFREGRRRLNLLWDEFDLCGYNDLDLYVRNENGALIGRGTKEQTLQQDNCHPSERITIEITEEGWHYLQVYQKGNNGIPTFDIMARGGFVYQGTTEHSIVDPGNHPNVLTVGAVRVDDYLHSSLEGFSSQGPNSFGLTKPDLVGPNGLTTLSYGPKNFFGTSASTPAVAGMFAVFMSGHPDLTILDGLDHLKWSAVSDDLFTSPTAQIGYGRARLPSVQSDIGCAGQGILILPMVLFSLRRRKNHHVLT